MYLIGEKLNSSIPRTLDALKSQDDRALTRLIRAQSESGADCLDINTALTGPAEKENMRRVVRLALEHSRADLMLDSPDPEVLLWALAEVEDRRVILNSVRDDDAYDELIHMGKAAGAGFVAMPISGGSVPQTAQERLERFLPLVSRLRGAGVPDDAIYLDAMMEALATNDQAGRITLQTIRLLRTAFPDTHILCGLSNISFGLPSRGKLNAAYLTMALACGLDAVIADPTAEKIQEVRAVSACLLGEDEYCLEYIQYERSLMG